MLREVAHLGKGRMQSERAVHFSRRLDTKPLKVEIARNASGERSLKFCVCLNELS
jgi:hypothetical protein